MHSHFVYFLTQTFGWKVSLCVCVCMQLCVRVFPFYCTIVNVNFVFEQLDIVTLLAQPYIEYVCVCVQSTQQKYVSHAIDDSLFQQQRAHTLHTVKSVIEYSALVYIRLCWFCSKRFFIFFLSTLIPIHD